MNSNSLGQLISDLASGRVRIVDLTQTLSPDFPQIVLPPEMGQCLPFRVEEMDLLVLVVHEHDAAVRRAVLTSRVRG